MKLILAFAAALTLSVSAASAQTQQPTPTVSGTTSPQSSPPAQAPGSVGTLPAQNTQPAADQTTTRTSTKDRKVKRNADMDKPRKQKKMSSEKM